MKLLETSVKAATIYINARLAYNQFRDVSTSDETPLLKARSNGNLGDIDSAALNQEMSAFCPDWQPIEIEAKLAKLAEGECTEDACYGDAIRYRHPSVPEGEKSEFDARYKIIEADKALTSHRPLKSFRLRRGYPKGVQDRDYANPAGQDQIAVIKNAQNLDPDLLLVRSVSASEGTPIVTTDNYVLSGNSRAMSTFLASKKHPQQYQDYRDSLYNQAREFGLDRKQLDRFKHPVLVREIEIQPSEIAVFASFANKPISRALDNIGKSLELAKVLEAQADIASTLQLQEGQTLRAFLSTADGRRFVEFLNANTSPTERGTYFRPDGQLTEVGKTVLEDAIFATVFDDRRSLESMSSAIRRALEASLPELIRLQQARLAGKIEDQDNLVESLKFAIDFIASNPNFGENPDEWIRQMAFIPKDDLKQGTLDAAAIDLMLQFGNKPRQLRDKIGSYLKELVFEKESTALFQQEARSGNEILRAQLATEGEGTLFGVNLADTQQFFAFYDPQGDWLDRFDGDLRARNATIKAQAGLNRNDLIIEHVDMPPFSVRRNDPVTVYIGNDVADAVVKGISNVNHTVRVIFAGQKFSDRGIVYPAEYVYPRGYTLSEIQDTKAEDRAQFCSMMNQILDGKSPTRTEAEPVILPAQQEKTIKDAFLDLLHRFTADKISASGNISAILPDSTAQLPSVEAQLDSELGRQIVAEGFWRQEGPTQRGMEVVLGQAETEVLFQTHIPGAGLPYGEHISRAIIEGDKRAKAEQIEADLKAAKQAKRTRQDWTSAYTKIRRDSQGKETRQPYRIFGKSFQTYARRRIGKDASDDSYNLFVVMDEDFNVLAGPFYDQGSGGRKAIDQAFLAAKKLATVTEAELRNRRESGQQAKLDLEKWTEKVEGPIEASLPFTSSEGVWLTEVTTNTDRTITVGPFETKEQAEKMSQEVNQLKENKSMEWLHERTNQIIAEDPPPASEPDKPEALPATPQASSYLDLETSRRAYVGSSWNPERRAKYDLDDFQKWMNHAREEVEHSLRLVDRTAEEKQKIRDEILEPGLLAYYDKLAQLEKNRIGATSRTMSSMVVGPANFPQASNRKKMDTERKRQDEVNQYAKSGLTKLKNLINPKAISADRDDAVDLLERKLEAAKRNHEYMKAANKIAKSKTLPRTEQVEQLQALSPPMTAEQANELVDGDYLERKGFASYAIQNSNANIKRIEQRIKDVAARQSGESTDYEFPDGTVSDNIEAQRIQIFYNSKPDYETRTMLKSRGFRWARSQGAWQRQRTNNAINITNDMLGIQIPRIP